MFGASGESGDVLGEGVCWESESEDSPRVPGWFLSSVR